MSETTFEMAKRCPSCEEPGKTVAVLHPRNLPRGTAMNTFECENARCERVGERWMVQTNPDGTIPQPGQKGPKAFEMPKESTTVMQAARDELRLIDAMSTHPGMTAEQVRRLLGG